MVASLGMERNMTSKRALVLRDGFMGYWLTIDPPHPKYEDEFLVDRPQLYQRAVEVMGGLGRAVCRDETTADLSNSDATNAFFASRQPWANNDYRPTKIEPEPSFFDAKLLPE